MACLSECLDLGPPPDSILFLPPPPAPSLPDLLLNTTPCSSSQICESFVNSNRIPDVGDYIEMPRKDLDANWSVSGIDDTWLLVLVASSIGVLLLGALLAMFLLKCREMNMFGSNECSMHNRDHHHRPSKNSHENRDCGNVGNLNSNKLVHPADAVLYHGAVLPPAPGVNSPANHLHDNRMVWAALTPRGTQHFISENYPRDLIDYVENDDHYETIDHLPPVVPPPPHPSVYNHHHNHITYSQEYDYEDPTPLIESYQLNDLELEGNPEQTQYQLLGNTDMRCASTLRRGLTIRPRVSSPTRIEHPNLPPLNLYPHKSASNNTLKRNTLNYRTVDPITLPKYGL